MRPIIIELFPKEKTQRDETRLFNVGIVKRGRSNIEIDFCLDLIN